MPVKPLDPRLATTMIQREKSARYNKQKSLSSRSFDETLASGEICGPLHPVAGPHSKSLWLQTKAYYARFRKGDLIELRVRNGQASTVVAHDLTVKDVTYPEVGVLRLEVTKKRDFTPEQSSELFAFPQEGTFFDDKIKKLLQEVEASPAPVSPLLKVKPQVQLLSGLNSVQQDAVQLILDQGMDGCIQGPPGTGKTQVLVALVAHCLVAGLRVGLASFTNTAVDNALSRIVAVMKLPQYARCGRKEKINTQLYTDPSFSSHIYGSLGEVPADCPLIANTTHAWILSAKTKIDVMIIDEAGQVASYMSPLLMRLAPHFILLGDDKQLPPVLTAQHGGEATDLFSLGRRAYQDKVPMLSIQYRMNHDIQAWSSDRLYEGLLRPDASVKDRDILAALRTADELGTQRVQLRAYNAPMIGLASTLEASLVVRYIQAALQNGIAPEGLGVITPHRVQAGAICAELQSQLDLELAQKIQVDTVERFQGQEREIILLSPGHAFDKSQDESNDAKMSFLSEARRLNVAVTRAKSRFVCFAGAGLLDEAKKAKQHAAVLVDFLQWCDEKSGNVGLLRDAS